MKRTSNSPFQLFLSEPQEVAEKRKKPIMHSVALKLSWIFCCYAYGGQLTFASLLSYQLCKIGFHWCNITLNPVGRDSEKCKSQENTQEAEIVMNCLLSIIYHPSIYLSVYHVSGEKKKEQGQRRERKLGILLQANLCFISFIAHQYSITWIYHNFSVSYLAFFQVYC